MGNDMTKMMTHFEYIRVELQAMRSLLEHR